MPFQYNGIVKVGNWQRRDPVVIGLKFSATNLLEPLWMVGLASAGGTTHHPEHQVLPRFAALIEPFVDQCVVDLAGLRLQFAPSPIRATDGRGNP
jgi:hypothetical protein